MSLLDRFLRYVRLDTQSDENSDTTPSTAGQLVLSRLLASECRELGLVDVSCDDHGIVMATIPPTVKHDAPMIVWNAHVDTSPEYTGANVQPIVHENYQGETLVLPGDPRKVLCPEDHPELRSCLGHTLVTTDGTTLLGADDKSGLAVIMTAAERLMAERHRPVGPIRLCFTVDEEIGRGTRRLDFDRLGGVCGYTLDSSGCGRVDGETFSADRATVTVTGVNTHPSEGKGVMVNAIRILSTFLARLPWDHLSPETTAGREGFLHPYAIEGGVARAEAKILLRDFDTPRLAEYASLLESIAQDLRRAHPRASIEVHIQRQYRNMRDGLNREPRALALALAAVRSAGLEPQLDIIRGGTDGALMTEQGLPTPNLSTGQHNPHSPLEWTSVDEMYRSVDVLLELARLWGAERVGRATSATP
jgi:tripeptide aminopeptidase